MRYRRAFLEALVLLGAATVLVTEAASAIHRLDRLPVTTVWALLLCVAVYARARRISWPATVPRLSPFDGLCVAAMATIADIIAATAFISPPNSPDAMAYHLPRVIYWLQARSIAFFPTPYLNQIMLQPVAEYLMLHTFLLSGGDRFVNLVQFLGFIGSVVGVSCIAAELGLPRRGQIFAALFCATIPNGILQASGAKNDYLLSLWLVAVLLFVIRTARGGSRRDLVFLGLATGLALGTKATAYLYAPPLASAAYFAAGAWPSKPVRALAAMAAGTLLINAPQFGRNWQLTGSILGHDSAQGDGAFRWRNEHFGWKPTISNLLRNTADQVGARAAGWNQAVYAAVLRAHLALGIDPQDPDTTWR